MADKMKHMHLVWSARSRDDDTTDYREISQFHLKVTQECIAGDGSSKHPFIMKQVLRNEGSQNFYGVLHVELVVEKEDPRFFLPGFMYGRNRGEASMFVKNEFPRMRSEYLGRPASPWWMMRADRLSHPIACIYDKGRVYAISAMPFFEKDKKTGVIKQQIHPKQIEQYAGFSCNLEKVIPDKGNPDKLIPDKDNLENSCGIANEWEKNYASVGYTLGYENAPWLFVQSHTVQDRAPLGENCFEVKAESEIEIYLEVFDYEAESELGVHQAIQTVYEKYHQQPRKIGSVETALRDLSGAVRDHAWLPKEHSYSGFVRLDSRGDFVYDNKILSLSWTNGFSVAVPMLLAANRLGDEKMRLQALDCMEHIMKNCMNPNSGLPFDACNDGKWSVHGWWYDGMHSGGHSSYLVGQFVYYLMKAYQNEQKTRKITHQDWMEYVKPILKVVNGEINREGEYPLSYSVNNAVGLEYDCMGGCWCLAATAIYEYLTGDRSYLEQLIQSEAHYYRKYIVKAECYGAPLDTDKAVDNEGILAFVRGCRYLHLITGDPVYLKHMKDGFDYEFSFKFGYNVPIQVPPLSTIGWSSCGGSITSVCNPHIHPMSSTIVGEMQYYCKHVKDSYVESRLADTILWGCQTYNTFDKEYGYGLKGWMSERFCYSQGLLVEKYPDGSPASTWFALMPWASCSIIEGLAEAE